MIKHKEESCALDWSGSKVKGNVKEIDVTLALIRGPSDRSKYKKLEIPVFVNVNLESWIYRDEHYFDIKELDDAEKIKVAVISFG